MTLVQFLKVSGTVEFNVIFNFDGFDSCSECLLFLQRVPKKSQ